MERRHNSHVGACIAEYKQGKASRRGIYSITPMLDSHAAVPAGA